jgi:hypothetical protein
MQMVRRQTGTSNLGQDVIGHPQLVDTFWHSFGQPAKEFVTKSPVLSGC